jgi:hypothetical protein
MMRFADDDKKNTEIISMPMTQFLQAPRKRNLVKEVQKDRPWKLVGEVHFKEAPVSDDVGQRKKNDAAVVVGKQIGKKFYLTPEMLLV